jgi:hypothetical protein
VPPGIVHLSLSFLRACFFEAEVTRSTVKRLTDNNVIEHVDLQNPGSFGKPASQPDISLARRRISRG